jgi:hypothetical protein
LRGAEFPDDTSKMLFILSYMKGGAAGTWATHKIQTILTPSETPMTMDDFEVEVDLVFADPNREATARQKLSNLRQGANSVDELIQQFEVHGPTSRLGDVGLVHHFEQALNSRLRESIYRLRPMPRTWVEWKREASILDNQWRRFNASRPQVATSKNSAATPTRSVAPPPTPSSARPLTSSAPAGKPAADPQPMDLDRTKSKGTPRTCYNCNRPGHIARNCPEPRAQRVRNTDPLSPEAIRAIAEAVRIAVGGDAAKGEEATGDDEPARSEAKESSDF